MRHARASLSIHGNAPRLAWAVAALCAWGACTPNDAPRLDPLTDQTVAIGDELTIVLSATDPDGDAIDYRYTADRAGLSDHAELSRRPDGAGVFRWRPVATEVGSWLVDFHASDGRSEDSLTIRIDVTSTTGSKGAPIFRKPLGTGTTLELSRRACLELDVLIEDADSTSVQIAEQEPKIPGAMLEVRDGLSARWTWCPTEAQVGERTRYTLTLSATDDTGAVTLKHYLIVLRAPAKGSCPGEAPVVEHTPADARTVNGLRVTATVRDDVGLKGAPLLYYAESEPAQPVDLSSLTQVSMQRIDGTPTAGTWGAEVPNPTTALPAGSTRALYYVIVADDDDDAEGSCDHTTTTEVFTMSVTNPGGAGELAVCERCTSDVQCGGAGDLCVRIGRAAEPFCMKACARTSDCAAGYTCSLSEVTSVDKAAAKQCVPISGSCAQAVCDDDAFEDNDNLVEAAKAAALAPNVYVGLVSCPLEGAGFGDEDWYRLEAAGHGHIELILEGTAATDLDVLLFDAHGVYVASSESNVSTESLTVCVAPGTYYARVVSWGAAANPYSLLYDFTPDPACAQACMDDGEEDDDSWFVARPIDAAGKPHIRNNRICPGDDDWYQVSLRHGQTLDVTVGFTQRDASEDLDVHLFDGAGVDLTPCSVLQPQTCDENNGQSNDSNEHFTYEVIDPSCQPCTFYTVIRGFNGASNTYDIAFDLR